MSNELDLKLNETFEDWEARNESTIRELWSITTGEGEMDNPLEVFTEAEYDRRCKELEAKYRLDRIKEEKELARWGAPPESWDEMDDPYEDYHS